SPSTAPGHARSRTRRRSRRPHAAFAGASAWRRSSSLARSAGDVCPVHWGACADIVQSGAQVRNVVLPLLDRALFPILIWYAQHPFFRGARGPPICDATACELPATKRGDHACIHLLGLRYAVSAVGGFARYV